MPDLEYRLSSALAIDRELLGLSDADYWQAYADQVHYVSGRAIEFVDRIIEASPGAVIVVFSDHGARSTSRGSDEWYRTFLAARTPRHRSLLAADARAQEIIPALFGAYFGIDWPTASDVTYVSPGGPLMPLSVEPRDQHDGE